MLFAKYLFNSEVNISFRNKHLVNPYVIYFWKKLKCTITITSENPCYAGFGAERVLSVRVGKMAERKDVAKKISSALTAFRDL